MLDQALGSVASAVEKRLETLFDRVESRALSRVFDTRFSSPVLDQVRVLTLRAGKRLRPALLTHGAALFDPAFAGGPQVTEAGAALELLHTYFLIHDDIMDDDDTRRGGPAVHVALAGVTKDRRMGQSLAILAGDLAVSLHGVLLANLAVEPGRQQRVLDLFACMHLDVVHGQTLDLLGSGEAEEIANRKTASYTTVGPLSIGATLAGAAEPEVEKLSQIARPLGVAFQLRDDVIGVFGKAQVTGKPVGTDLKSNKQTVLLRLGLEMADQDQRRDIEAVLGRPDAPEEDLGRACDALVRSGALASCQSRISELTSAFEEGIETGGYCADGARFLLEVARFIGSREK